MHRYLSRSTKQIGLWLQAPTTTTAADQWYHSFPQVGVVRPVSEQSTSLMIFSHPHPPETRLLGKRVQNHSKDFIERDERKVEREVEKKESRKKLNWKKTEMK